MEQGFELPLYLDLFAVFLMAATGAIEAIRHKFDLVGCSGCRSPQGWAGHCCETAFFSRPVCRR
jgi:hypothetical protein